MTVLGRPLDQFAIGIRNPEAGANQGYATAFFGQNHGRIGLYTAAHNLARTKVDPKAFIPTNNLSWLVPTIEVYLKRDRSAMRMLRLHPAQDQGDLVSATLVVTSPAPCPDHVWDVALLSSNLVDDLLDAAGDRVAVVNVDKADEPLSGAQLRCVGFPPPSSIAELDTWICEPATSYEGALIRTVEHHLQVGFRPDGGLSGAPVFTKEHKFAGMLVGKDVAPDLASQYPHMLARIVPASVFAGL